jgi:hypothetical protein
LHESSVTRAVQRAVRRHLLSRQSDRQQGVRHRGRRHDCGVPLRLPGRHGRRQGADPQVRQDRCVDRCHRHAVRLGPGHRGGLFPVRADAARARGECHGVQLPDRVRPRHRGIRSAGPRGHPAGPGHNEAAHRCRRARQRQHRGHDDVARARRRRRAGAGRQPCRFSSHRRSLA